ncbi:MAG: CU044_2847 family protein [Gammaproteobacteria bacterium]
MSDEKHLVEFELGEDGEGVVFEVTQPEVQGDFVRVSRNSEGVVATGKKFKELASSIRPAAEVVIDALKEINTPQEIELEFGIKFGVSGGVIFASADSEANFKIKVKWVNPPPPDTEPGPRTNGA